MLNVSSKKLRSMQQYVTGSQTKIACIAAKRVQYRGGIFCYLSNPTVLNTPTVLMISPRAS